MDEARTVEGSRRLGEILTAAWQDIPHEHLPSMQVTAWRTGRGELFEGRVLPGRWDAGGDGVVELALDRRCLAEGPEAVLGMLLHAAAHAIVDGDFRAGERPPRYHTERFGFIADLVGLRCDFEPGRGWAATQPTATALVRHHATIVALEQALASYVPGTDGPRGGGGGRQVALTCGCPQPRRIWSAPSTAAGPPIRCDACGAAFTVPVDVPAHDRGRS